MMAAADSRCRATKNGLMWRGACLVIIVAAAAWCVYGTFFGSQAYGDWGVSTAVPGLSSDTRVFIARRVESGSPAARAGIVAGDRLRSLVPHAFLRLFPKPGERVAFEVTRGSSRRTVTLVAATRYDVRHPTEIILFGLEMTELALAFLLTWRRWSDRDARPLIVFFTGHASTMGAAFSWQPLGPLALPIFYLVNFSAAAGLLRFTAIYPSNAPSSTFRRAFAGIAPGFALVSAVTFAAWVFTLQWFNVSFFGYALYRYVELALYDVLPVVGLLAGLIGSVSADRKRLALLLAFFLIGDSGPIAYSILVAAGGPGVSTGLRPLLATLIVMGLGFVYLIFRERLFDVSFVLNRTAVYAAVSTFLVPLLLVGEWLAQRALTAGNETENGIVQVGIALLLFVIARQLYERIDRVVDRLLFRERHENEAALRGFARRVALLDDAKSIGEQAVQTVCAHTDASGAALYRRDADESYALIERKGDSQLPARVGRNDPVVLALRADRAPVENLRESPFADALVLPVIGARGLGEFLVCGSKRSGEAYAPDERNALLQLAHGVAVALDAVHISELQRDNARFRAALQPST
jgi:hypothetical protein